MVVRVRTAGEKDMLQQRGKRAAATLALVGTATAWAAEHTELTAVEVRGEPAERGISEALADHGNRVEIIDRERISASGAVDIAQALQMLAPGLHVAPKHGRFDYADISLHGSRNDDVLFLIDGVRVNNRLFASTSPLDTLGTNMVERIEILKGGQSLFYGTQAVAGVVNIVTREFAEATEGELALGAGSLGEQQLKGWMADAHGDNRFVLSGSHARSDGYQPYRDAHREPSAAPGRKRGYEVTSLAGRMQRRFGDNARLTGSYVRTDAALDFARATDNFNTVNDRDQQLATLNWDHHFDNGFSYFLKGYWHRWDTEYTRLYTTEDEDRLEVVNDRDPWGFEDYGLNLMGRYAFDGGSEWIFGVDGQRYSGEDAVVNITTQRETVYAAFLQFRPRLALLPHTALAIGARHSRADLGGANTIWDASARHALGGGHYLRAKAGSAFRLPDAFQLFAQDPEHTRGNEDLDGEQSLNFELGYGGNAALAGIYVSWELMGFQRRIEDLIARVSDEDGLTTFVNTDERVDSRGVDLVGRWNTGDGWRGHLGVTATRARERDSSRQIDGIPRFFAKTSFGRDHAGGRWGWTLAAVHVGRTTDTLSDGLGRQRYGNHEIVDLTAYWRPAAGSPHRFSLRLENALGATYASGITSATRDADDSAFRVDNLGMPRNIQLRYRYRFL